MQATPQRIGYMRVSTRDQREDRQAEGLHAVCDRLYLEKISAAAAHRPVFREVLDCLRPGDTLVVWDFDRAFRSTLEALTTAEGLRARGVFFQVVSLGIDTGTDEGELVCTMLAGIAQYERRLIARRTRQGMEAARNRGRPIGRPRRLSDNTVREAHEAVTGDGLPCRYVAALLGVSRITLQRAFRRHGLGAQAQGPVGAGEAVPTGTDEFTACAASPTHPQTRSTTP